MLWRRRRWLVQRRRQSGAAERVADISRCGPRIRTEREALCAELHSVEDEAAAARAHGVGRGMAPWPPRRSVKSAAGAVRLRFTEPGRCALIERPGASGGAAPNGRSAGAAPSLLAFARWSAYVRALDTTSDGARRSADSRRASARSTCSRRRRAPRAPGCEQLTIDNASLQRRLAAEEERSRSLVRVGQQAAARAAAAAAELLLARQELAESGAASTAKAASEAQARSPGRLLS